MDLASWYAANFGGPAPGGPSPVQQAPVQAPSPQGGGMQTLGGGPFFGGPRTITAAPGGPVVGHGPPGRQGGFDNAMVPPRFSPQSISAPAMQPPMAAAMPGQGPRFGGGPWGPTGPQRPLPGGGMGLPAGPFGQQPGLMAPPPSFGGGMQQQPFGGMNILALLQALQGLTMRPAGFQIPWE